MREAVHHLPGGDAIVLPQVVSIGPIVGSLQMTRFDVRTVGGLIFSAQFTEPGKAVTDIPDEIKEARECLIQALEAFYVEKAAS